MNEDDAASLGENLAALDDTPMRGRPRAGAGPIKVIAAILGVSVLWGGILALHQSRQASDTLAVAEPEEFQPAGAGWETMPTQKSAPEVPAPIPVAAQPSLPPAVPASSEPSQPDEAMMQTLAELRAELEALREAAAPAGGEQPDEDGTAAQLASLSAQVSNLASQSANLQDALEDAQRQAKQEQLRADGLQAQLLAAQFDGSGPTLPPGGLEASPLGDTEAERLAALEARRARAEAERQARISSPIVAFGGSGVGATGAAAGPDLGQNEEFLRAGARRAEVEQATVIANPSRTVIQGTVIQAALETAIVSDLPGAIRAVVSEDVHSFDGTRVLIPRGSKLLGRYNSQIEPTQRRLMVAWDRILTPDGQSVSISAYGADELGRSGTAGRIDRRLGTRFGSAALVSLISALPAAAAASVEDPLASELAEELGGDAEDASRSVLDGYLAVPPTLFIDQGARITVLVDRDLELLG
ncbi:TrbI/VirB10 family protein [Rubellimicrobium aerolatum]|uniref:TrbI/VirB10 family protein n=1 Tax=Rubellimicrobium aerolatum TaxID=490979 RepID=A0ABW0SE30_9RHOB|nr:TrbI/VirB10 family protein [Rubellimicrobium aerolatum]MBP1806988.1 type IV secretion system protein VirB10 [Rubellimicrobium aerolatum]